MATCPSHHWLPRGSRHWGGRVSAPEHGLAQLGCFENEVYVVTKILPAQDLAWGPPKHTC